MDGNEGHLEAARARDREAQCASVHRRLKRIAKARGALDLQEGAALREAERLRVWRHYGYASLLEYLEMELGHSPRAALERLRVANAIVELPAIAEAMSQGELSFSAARELTRVATAETEGVWLEAAGDKNLRQVENLVSGHKRGAKPTDPPEPSLRKQRLRFDELEPETIAMIRQARQILERECGERLDDDAFLRALGRMVIDGAACRVGGDAPAQRTRAPYQIAVVTCDACKRAWQDGGGITVEMSAATRDAAECDAQHIGRVDRDDCVRDAQHIGRIDRDASIPDSDDPVDSDRPTIRERKPGRVRTTVSPALRRKVSARDHGRCRVPWCRSSSNIDLHHINPISEGGQHTAENLITLCESHHIALHEGALAIEGDAATATITHRARSSFTTVQHAVDTATALRKLGFDKHEVKTAVEKARTHVGTSALPLEQWIKIALGYCPKPTG